LERSRLLREQMVTARKRGYINDGKTLNKFSEKEDFERNGDKKINHSFTHERT